MSILEIPSDIFRIIHKELPAKAKRRLSLCCRQLHDDIVNLESAKPTAVVEIMLVFDRRMAPTRGLPEVDFESGDEEEEDPRLIAENLALERLQRMLNERAGGPNFRIEVAPRKKWYRNERTETLLHRCYHDMKLHVHSKPTKHSVRMVRNDDEVMVENAADIARKYNVTSWRFALKDANPLSNFVTEAEVVEATNVIEEILREVGSNSFSLSNTEVSFKIPDVDYTDKPGFEEDDFSMYFLLDYVNSIGVKKVSLRGWTDWIDFGERPDMVPQLAKYKFSEANMEMRLVKRAQLDDGNLYELVQQLRVLVVSALKGELPTRSFDLLIITRLKEEMIVVRKMLADFAFVAGQGAGVDERDGMEGSFARTKTRVSWMSPDAKSVKIRIKKDD